MSEKIIDEVSRLVDDYVGAMFAVSNASTPFELNQAHTKAKQRNEAIRAKLREVLERKPLSALEYNQIPALCSIPPSKYESIVRAIERAHNIK